jgi:hypothetical protein
MWRAETHEVDCFFCKDMMSIAVMNGTAETGIEEDMQQSDEDGPVVTSKL